MTCPACTNWYIPIGIPIGNNLIYIQIEFELLLSGSYMSGGIVRDMIFVSLLLDGTVSSDGKEI